ncbi:putative sucrose-phosphate synthase 1 [Nymphaea thermarum]|nr:putative sucrose-phosphate synthase 1 [Nymphaea thermarum]
MKKKRKRRPNSGFLCVQDSRRPLFVIDLMDEGESSALPSLPLYRNPASRPDSSPATPFPPRSLASPTSASSRVFVFDFLPFAETRPSTKSNLVSKFLLEDAQIQFGLHHLLNSEGDPRGLKHLRKEELVHQLGHAEIDAFLLRCQSDPVIALGFFNWVRNEVGIKPSTRNYCTMVHILAWSRLFSQGMRLLGEVVGTDRQLFVDLIQAAEEPFGLTLIEASAHGLPIVATKNGGPVDIHRVLDNGLLVDPHDQKAIADALLKLVADKQLWTKCRQNGLKNIHFFSWPEHCKTYLSRIASCRPRHPQWQFQQDDAGLDSPSDSLRDIQDLSLNLKLSLDGEKNEESGSLESESTAENVKRMANAVIAASKRIINSSHKIVLNEKVDPTGNSKFPALRRRKHIFVICVDCGATADLSEEMDYELFCYYSCCWW